MDFELQPLRLADAATGKAPALVVLVADGFVAGDDALSALIARALGSGDFKTEAGAQLFVYGAADIAPPRVVLAGIGDGSAARVRKAVAAAMGAVRGSPAKALTLCFAQPTDAAALRAAVLTVADASYVYRATKSKPKDKKEPPRVARVLIGAPDAGALREPMQQAVGVARGVELAREWANRPANHATPAMLADAARQLAKLPRIACDVLGPKEVGRLGMGAFQAVAQGSRQELRFIVLRYDGAPKSEAPVVLVGKGITFDTGGISIKPAAGMEDMKWDMGGAGAVAGAMKALAGRKAKAHVVGICGLVENMPDGNAQRPGDVVTSMSGQTIEVINTDAEGRLVLCDALHYAQENFKPDTIIDLATLTGAIIISLGKEHAGLFSNSDELSDQLLAAGKASGDKLWRFPLSPAYDKLIDSPIADIKNVGPRDAGSITAAQFLQRFIQDGVKWAHLDIAGMAWGDKDGPTWAKGATGYGVKLLDRFIADNYEG